MMLQTNILPVIVAAIAGWIIGAAWYSPFIFGKPWASLAKVKFDRGNMIKSALPGFISFLVIAYVLSLFMMFARVTTVPGGIVAGFFMWIGFVATTSLGSIIYERKPIKLYLLNNAYYLLALMVMGAIMSAWM